MKAYKYRIYPNADQRELFAQHFGCARHVYNWALTLKQQHYEEHKKNLSRFELQHLLVAAKKQEKQWLAEVNSQTLLSALLHLHVAFTNFFEKRAKFPRFKKKYSSNQAFQCPQHVVIDAKKSLLHLPKIKGIKIKLHRAFAGIIKTVTIKRSSCGVYYASVLVDNGDIDPIPTTIIATQTLGLDVGITRFYTDSDGNGIENPKFLKRSLDKLKAANRLFIRKKNHSSSNRAKSKLLLSQVHNRVKNLRNNFIQQESAKLAVKNQATSFAVESLNIKGMIKNRKLSRAIADCGWGMFLSALAYKCKAYGKNLLKIDRFAASSKTCSSCGTKLQNLPLAVRNWTCACGVSHDRDHNAAKMIKQFALAAFS